MFAKEFFKQSYMFPNKRNFVFGLSQAAGNSKPGCPVIVSFISAVGFLCQQKGSKFAGLQDRSRLFSSGTYKKKPAIRRTYSNIRRLFGFVLVFFLQR